jgi:hypothetical protein
MAPERPADPERGTSPPEDDAPEGPGWIANLPWGLKVALAGGLIAAVALAGFVSTRGGPEQRGAAAPEPPQEGVACPHLRKAFEHYQVGDDQAFREAVRTAARVGEQTLQRSGQVFGPPEIAALELDSALAEEGASTAKIEGFLTQARQACTRLGIWPMA